MQHYARLKSSLRLQCVLQVLRKSKGEISNYDLMMETGVVAVAAAVSELRCNGFEINCIQRHELGKRRFYYSLIKEPQNV